MVVFPSAWEAKPRVFVAAPSACEYSPERPSPAVVRSPSAWE
jgi:hypothetical protein